MNDSFTTRRRFIVAAVTLSTITTSLSSPSWLSLSAAWAGSTDDSAAAQTLFTGAARLLFPHDRIPDSVYASVMTNVLAAAANDPGLSSTLQSAEDSLNSRRSQPWVALESPEQLAVLQEVQGESFFVVLTETVRGNFYYHPDVWKYIDYPGSSKEFGGYIHRGFDDIDWLPEGS